MVLQGLVAPIMEALELKLPPRYCAADQLFTTFRVAFTFGYPKAYSVDENPQLESVQVKCFYQQRDTSKKLPVKRLHEVGPSKLALRLETFRVQAIYPNVEITLGKRFTLRVVTGQHNHKIGDDSIPIGELLVTGKAFRTFLLEGKPVRFMVGIALDTKSGLPELLPKLTISFWARDVGEVDPGIELAETDLEGKTAHKARAPPRLGRGSPPTLTGFHSGFDKRELCVNPNEYRDQPLLADVGSPSAPPLLLYSKPTPHFRRA